MHGTMPRIGGDWEGDWDYVTEALYFSTMRHPSCTGTQGLALTL